MTDTSAEAVDCIDDYDCGLINDYGGGNVDWWMDYLRAEIGRANDHWRDAARQLIPALSRDLEAMRARVAELEGALQDCVAMLERANSKTGECCCGVEVDTHPDSGYCGHAIIDMGEYYAGLAIASARAALSQEGRE